jgi:hypothetical protein
MQRRVPPLAKRRSSRCPVASADSSLRLRPARSAGAKLRRFAVLAGLAALALMVGLAGVAGPARAQLPEHVVVVFLDGPRFHETIGQPEHIPWLWGQLRPAGAVLTEFYNLGTTMTVSGHASVMTGTLQDLRNDGSERPHAPTFFELLRMQSGLPAESLWVVAGKRKLAALSHSDCPGYGADFGARDSVELGPDPSTFAVLASVLTNWRPRLTLVNLASIDLRGHDGDWDGYLAAITIADSLLGRVWEVVQADPQLSGTTTLLVTYDHGRHDSLHDQPHDGFANHGCPCHGCRHIALFARGPGIRAGVQSPLPRDMRDLGATIALLLGVQAPTIQGRPIAEILTLPGIKPEGPPRPAACIASLGTNRVAAQLSMTVQLTSEASVDLGVYDLQGVCVRSLQTGRLAAGARAFVWDGRTRNGQEATSGVYTVRLFAPGSVDVAQGLLAR